MPNAPITPGSGLFVATNTVTRDTVTEHMEIQNLGDPLTATAARIDAAGELRVALQSTQLFYDDFAAGLDTVARYLPPTAGGGGVAATNAAPSTVLSTGTIANGWSVLQSAVAFVPPEPGWLQLAVAVNLENPITTNAYRFWGVGTSPTTPTASAPLTDASGFEIYTDGKLYCVQYSGGVRGVVQDCSAATGNAKQPADAAIHQYGMLFRGDRTYFTIDGIDNVVGSIGATLGPNTNVLPFKATAIAGSTAPTSAGLLTLNAVYLSDTAGNNRTISDATFPWRKAKISSAGQLLTQAAPIGASGIGTLANGAANLVIPVQGYSGIALTITGTWSGVIQFNADDGSGTYPWSLPLTSATGPTLTTVAGNASLQGLTNAHSTIQLSWQSYTSGTATISWSLGGSIQANVSNTGDSSAPTLSPPALTYLYGYTGGGYWDRLRDVFTGHLVTSTSTAKQRFSMNVTGAAGIVAETALSMTRTVNGVATAAVTSFTVPVGQTLRLTSARFATRGTAAGNCTFRVRNTSVTGAIELGVSQNFGAVANNNALDVMEFPDGAQEYLTGTVLLISQQASVTTLLVDAMLVGYLFNNLVS